MKTFAFGLAAALVAMSVPAFAETCPDTTPTTIVCTGTAGPMIKLVLASAPTFAETVELAAAPGAGDNLFVQFDLDGTTYEVYDLASQGYPDQPIYAVAR